MSTVGIRQLRQHILLLSGRQTKLIRCACYDREARKQKDEDILNDKAKGGDYSTTGTLLDPYGKEPSKYPTKSS